MIIAKSKVGEEEDHVVIVVEYIFDDKTRSVLVLQHNFIRMSDEELSDQDYVAHQVQPYAVVHHVDGCAFLDLIGNEKKAGRLIDVQDVEEYPSGEVVRSGGEDRGSKEVQAS